MVKTGARARALQHLLEGLGLEPIATSIPGPRTRDLPTKQAERILDLYRALGGRKAFPLLRPGTWDLVFSGGFAVELDEELHFNRYRFATLQPAWGAELPWRNDYLSYTVDHEPECFAAARWGNRWTNPSCEALFGAADPPGTFATGGAPRWKQRALYDAMKDVAALSTRDLRLARIATVDPIGGIRLGTALAGATNVDLDELGHLIARRST